MDFIQGQERGNPLRLPQVFVTPRQLIDHGRLCGGGRQALVNIKSAIPFDTPVTGMGEPSRASLREIENGLRAVKTQYPAGNKHGRLVFISALLFFDVHINTDLTEFSFVAGDTKTF